CGAGSTLTTSAPSSAKISPAVGPITVCVNSRTFRPERGRADISPRATNASQLCVLPEALPAFAGRAPQDEDNVARALKKIPHPEERAQRASQRTHYA